MRGRSSLAFLKTILASRPASKRGAARTVSTTPADPNQTPTGSAQTTNQLSTPPLKPLLPTTGTQGTPSPTFAATLFGLLAAGYQRFFATAPAAPLAIKGSDVLALHVTDPRVQQVKSLTQQIYALVEKGEIVAANKLAKDTLFKIVDVQTAIEICNLLLRKDEAFRNDIQKCIENALLLVSPLIKNENISADGKPVPVFRSVIINGHYGDPVYITEHGFTATLFNPKPNPTAGDYVSMPSVITVVPKEVEPGKYEAKLNNPRQDKFGFTFGPLISTSFNLFHALDQRYANPSERQKNSQRVVCLIALDKGFNIAKVVHQEAGFKRDRNKGKLGEKGTSNALDAAEVAAGPMVNPKCLLGHRIVFPNGELGPFVRNPDSSEELLKEFMDYSDVRIFLEAKSLDHARELEALIVADPAKVEDHNKKILGFLRKNETLTKEILAQARGHGRNELLYQQTGAHLAEAESESNREHTNVMIQAHTHRKELEEGKVHSGAKRFFHDQVAGSEEELKKRAIEAKKQLVGETKETDTNPTLQRSNKNKK